MKHMNYEVIFFYEGNKRTAKGFDFLKHAVEYFNNSKAFKARIYKATHNNTRIKFLREEIKTLQENKPGFVVQKALSPYLENGKTRFSIRNVPGVYLIYKNKELVYVGFSASDVYKALYRHLQSWNDKHQQRITFKSDKGITVRMVYTPSGAKARKLEGALILKHRPPLNINKYDGYVTDEEEKKLLKEFESAPKEGIYQFEGDLPF